MFKNKLTKLSNPKTKDLYRINRRTPFWKVFLLLAPAIAILTMFTIVPFIYAVKDGFFLNDKKPLADPSFSWNNFKFVAQDEFFIKSIKNSMIYAIIVVPITIIFSLLISSVISSVIRKRLRGFLQTIFFLPYVTSAISISLAFAFIFDFDTGLLNKIIESVGGKKISFTNDTEGNHALIVMGVFGVWRGLAFNVLIFTTAMMAVDKNKYKAASIDGASGSKQFFKITLPSINRTTNFLIIMGIIGAIKVFPLALFNNNVGTARVNGANTLMLYVFGQISSSNYGRAGVASLYLLIISIGFSAILKGGYNQLLRLANFIGEKRVENKIKNFK